MARFARIDSQIRANRLILANRFQGSQTEPFFANRASGGLTIANRRFEAIRANRSHVMILFFSRESPQFALRIAGPSKVQIQNFVARRSNVHYRDRSVKMLVEGPSLQFQILSRIPTILHIQT